MFSVRAMRPTWSMDNSSARKYSRPADGVNSRLVDICGAHATSISHRHARAGAVTHYLSVLRCALLTIMMIKMTTMIHGKNIYHR